MKKTLQFDFIIDRNTNSVFVTKEFDAELDLVWNAFTKQEVLDKWWAPQPWASKTKFSDFKVGGRRFYAMVGPDGQEIWSIQDFTSITPTKKFKFFDAFSDKDENINSELPSSEWNLDFKETNGVTRVEMTVKHKTLTDLEQVLDMGFQEGFTKTLNDLEVLLDKMKSK